MSNLGKRAATAAVAIPAIAAICVAGGVWFFLFVALASALALREFYGLVRAKGAVPNAAVGIVAGVMVNAAFFHPKLAPAVTGLLLDAGYAAPFPSQSQLLVIVLLLTMLACAAAGLFAGRGPAIAGVAATLTGVVYVSFFFGSFIGLREVFTEGSFPAHRWFPDGHAAGSLETWDTVYRWGGYMTISVLAIIWICDTAAYHTGLAVGRRKLFERVSPNKTWEGAAAGFAAALAAAVAAKFLVLEFLDLADAAVVGLIAGTLGQVGDLFESSLKRDAGVKDSSALLPGHGGVLDRFDSLLFTAPAVYLYIDFVVLS